jgi:hypothetical protein
VKDEKRQYFFERNITMEEGRIEILKMLEEKKITVDEAMELLQALNAAKNGQENGKTESAPKPPPSWDRHTNDHEESPKLRRFNLAGANLSGVIFEGAKMDGVSIAAANLDGANFRNADLRDADLSGANLDSANFEGANLRRAKLTGANLGDANFAGANLEDADLSGANLPDTDFTDANLHGQSLAGTNLAGMAFRDIERFFTSKEYSQE